MRSNRLQLNLSQTELLCCSSAWHTFMWDFTDINKNQRCIDNHSVYGARSLCISTPMSLWPCTSLLCSAPKDPDPDCASLPRATLVTLLRALVISKVDYSNTVLVGMTRTQLTRLHSVLNAAVRLLFSALRSLLFSMSCTVWGFQRDPVSAVRPVHGPAPINLAASLYHYDDCNGW